MGFELDQTLHGYSHGHSLLQTSIRLSPETEHLMLSLSDMSGPGMRPGFETYLTAYPIIAERMYVFARTWYASEMQRPGCVWTHSLLIREQDVGVLRDANSLLHFFRRPLSDVSFYGTKVAVPRPENQLFDMQPVQSFDYFQYAPTIWHLYGIPDKPVYVLAQASEQYETMVLQLWSQQWPQLRSAFTFCTGALANRTIKGKSFDLQVVPAIAISELRNDLLKGSVIDKSPDPTGNWPPNLTGELNQPNGWVSAAVNDLTSDKTHELRTTAWKLGNGISDRSGFAAVFHIASVVTQHRGSSLSAQDVVQAIVSIPSDISIPASLLKSLFGPKSPLVEHIPEADFLYALATVKAENLSVTDLNIANRAQDLWRTDRAAALDLFAKLIERETTPIGSEILMGISGVLESEDLSTIAQVRPFALTAILRQKPILASSPAIWQVSENLQVEIFHAFMSMPINQAALDGMVGATLLARSEVAPQQALEYGGRLVVPLLEWLNANPLAVETVPKAWARYLRANADTAIAWLSKERSVNPEVLNLLAISLPADNAAVNSVNLETWTPLLKAFSTRHDVATATFLFAIGLRHCDSAALSFIRESFQIVYDVAFRNSLDYDLWRPIESVAPALDSWKEWDKCERMSAALVDRFIRCGWARTELLQSVKKAVPTLEQVFGLWNTKRSRKKFLKSVAKAGLQLPLDPDYRRVLNRFD